MGGCAGARAPPRALPGLPSPASARLFANKRGTGGRESGSVACAARGGGGFGKRGLWGTEWSVQSCISRAAPLRSLAAKDREKLLSKPAQDSSTATSRLLLLLCPLQAAHPHEPLPGRRFSALGNRRAERCTWTRCTQERARPTQLPSLCPSSRAGGCGQRGAQRHWRRRRAPAPLSLNWLRARSQVRATEDQASPLTVACVVGFRRNGEDFGSCIAL